MLRAPRSWEELTPAWLTEALSRSFPGAVVKEAYVGGVAHGTNDRAHVRLTYAAGAGPERVFVKREGSLLNRLALTALGAREAEADLALADAELPLERPTFYAAAVDRRRLAAVTVMEDVTLRDARPHSAITPLTLDQVASGLRGLARLHATYRERPLPAFVRPWRLPRAWAPVSGASLANARRRLRALGHADLLPDTVAAIDRGFRAWPAVAAAGPQTLLHGDPHPGNTYALPDGTTGFYDWQLVRSGRWVHDVGYFVVSGLSVADRRVHERDLLALYLAERGGDEPDAWDLYRRTPVFGLGSWLHTLSGGGFQPVDVCLATIERFAAAYADHASRSRT